MKKIPEQGTLLQKLVDVLNSRDQIAVADTLVDLMLAYPDHDFRLLTEEAFQSLDPETKAWWNGECDSPTTMEEDAINLLKRKGIIEND